MSFERIKSVIFGGALGDAMGLMTEFMTKEEVTKNYGKIQNFSFNTILDDAHRSTWINYENRNLGDWSDDTDQMIINIKTICDDKQFDPKVFAKKFVKWMDQGFLKCGDTHGHGAGNTTSIWWGDKYSLSNPIFAGQRIFIYHPYLPCKIEANGGIMRIGVLGLLPNIDNIIDATIKSCSITHSSPRCVASSLFVTILIHCLTLLNKNNINLNDIFDQVFSIIKVPIENYVNYFNNEIQKIINTTNPSDDFYKVFSEAKFEPYDSKYIFQELQNITKINSLDMIDVNNDIGHTYHPLECGIYALKQIVQGKKFENIIIEILSEGADADTNCCVAGSIMGAILSYDELPQHIISNLKYRDYLDQHINKFIKAISF